MGPLSLPGAVQRVVDAIVAAGGRPWLVGGCVRDLLTDLPLVDWDIEVYRLDVDDLVAALRSVGRVDAVGRAFGVLKCRPKGWMGPDIDVSIPRRDSKVGPGHRGISVQGDPDMTPVEAARRRDLTVNAMGLDLVTGELHDAFGGQDDLKRRRLRAVDATTFLEDPLRALRVAQFAARLDFDVDPLLVALCRDAALDELPAERVGKEWEKLWLKGVKPSRGLQLARDAGIDARLFPHRTDHASLCAAADVFATVRSELPGQRAWCGALALWLHHTVEPAVEGILDRLAVFTANGWPVRRAVIDLLRVRHVAPREDTPLRRVAAVADLRVALTVRHCHEPEAGWASSIFHANFLGIADAAPVPLVRGRDLARLGWSPGPEMGAELGAVYGAQLDGIVTTADEALDWVRSRRPQA